jgi:LAO/AO transport system kinase
VSPPGLGDDIQAIKAGILEVADVHVVSKCDRPDANRMIADLKNMLALGSETTFSGSMVAAVGNASGKVVSDPTFAWRPPVIATSAIRDQGVAELLDAIDRHRAMLEPSREIDARRALIAERRLLSAGEGILRDQFERNREGKVAALVEQLKARALSPHMAATRLLREIAVGGGT